MASLPTTPGSPRSSRTRSCSAASSSRAFASPGTRCAPRASRARAPRRSSRCDGHAPRSRPTRRSASARSARGTRRSRGPWACAAARGSGTARRPRPPSVVEGRLATLAEWLEVAGPRDLAPDQAAAVALARLVEILPFDDANGRVSRLAASHLMVRGGMRPPILVAGDAPRLRAALESAFRLETEPLVALLAEASGRALDVMIQSLSGRAGRSACATRRFTSRATRFRAGLPDLCRVRPLAKSMRTTRPSASRKNCTLAEPAGGTALAAGPRSPIAGRRPESRSTTRPARDVDHQRVLGEERAPEGRHEHPAGSDLGPDAQARRREVERHLGEARARRGRRPAASSRGPAGVAGTASPTTMRPSAGTRAGMRSAEPARVATSSPVAPSRRWSRASTVTSRWPSASGSDGAPRAAGEVDGRSRSGTSLVARARRRRRGRRRASRLAARRGARVGVRGDEPGAGRAFRRRTGRPPGASPAGSSWSPRAGPTAARRARRRTRGPRRRSRPTATGRRRSSSSGGGLDSSATRVARGAARGRSKSSSAAPPPVRAGQRGEAPVRREEHAAAEALPVPVRAPADASVRPTVSIRKPCGYHPLRLAGPST